MPCPSKISVKKQSPVKAHFIAGLILGMLFGASGLVLGQNLVLHDDGLKDKSQASTRELTVEPLAELPPEWTWKKKKVTFDHMYRDTR